MCRTSSENLKIEDGDWRLTNQENYLMNARLMFEKYESSPQWGHDHCVFCFAKFGSQDTELHFGFCTLDKYHWICMDCFEDFREKFGWSTLLER